MPKILILIQYKMTLFEEIQSETDFNFETIQKDVGNDYLLGDFLKMIVIGQNVEQLKIAFGFFGRSYFINKKTHDTEKSLALAVHEYLEKVIGV